MLNMGIYNVGLEQDEAFRYCGAGYSMRSYDVDGRVYPCQFFMPLSVGEDKAQKANEIVFPSEEIPKELLDDKCRSCIVVQHVLIALALTMLQPEAFISAMTICAA